MLLKPVIVDVWIWRLSPDRAAFDAYWAVLSPDERARASRYVHERDRRRFVAARGRLREVLGQRASCGSAEVAFVAGEHGKPRLAGSALHFNLSHSSDLAVLGVCSDTEIGVDVERVGAADLALARRFFSPAEQGALEALPPETQSAGFFNCWTRKEAFVKALGKGLSLPLHQFDVSVAPSESPRLLRVDPAIGHDVRAWSMHAFAPAPGYIAAIAARTGSGVLGVNVTRD